MCPTLRDSLLPQDELYIYLSTTCNSSAPICCLESTFTRLSYQGRVHSYPNEIAIGQMLVPCNDGGCDGIAAAIISPHNDGGSNAVCCSYSFHQNIMKFVVIVCASTSVVPYGNPTANPAPPLDTARYSNVTSYRTSARHLSFPQLSLEATAILTSLPR